MSKVNIGEYGDCRVMLFKTTGGKESIGLRFEIIKGKDLVFKLEWRPGRLIEYTLLYTLSHLEDWPVREADNLLKNTEEILAPYYFDFNSKGVLTLEPTIDEGSSLIEVPFFVLDEKSQESFKLNLAKGIRELFGITGKGEDLNKNKEDKIDE